MQVRFISPSDDELNEAVEYYNYELKDLGKKFFQEVSNTIERIVRFPNAWPKIGNFTRRCLLKRFPYAIFYTVDHNGDILVLAIANLHRNPNYYVDRIS